MLRRALAAVVIALCAAGAGAQSIVTYAGGGTVDGQLLSDIVVSGACGIAFDKAGNILVVLRYSGQVLKIDAATHVVTTIAGNGAAGFTGDRGLAVNASMRLPFGIALDNAGNIYITDSENDRVRRIDAKSGIITTFAGGGTPESGIGDGGQAKDAYVGKPGGIAIDRGFMYITEHAYNANRVRRIELATGIITTIAGTTDGSLADFSGDGGPAKDARLSNPYGIAADAQGNLYVVDTGNSAIRRIDIASGIITTYAGRGPQDNIADDVPATSADLGTPLVVAFDRNGNLIVGAKGGLRRIDKNTKLIHTLVLENELMAGLAVDAQGAIYDADGFGRISRLAPGATQLENLSGNGSYVGDGLVAKAAVLHSPQGLAFDSHGNLFIVDQQANIIRRVSAADGTISTVAGIIGLAYAQDQEGKPAKEAAIGYPTDIAFDAADNLYIADELNGIVWRVDTAGKITTYAGGGSPADGIGDNGPATSARIIPWGITFDLNSNLLIADNDAFADVPHAHVRKVNAATKIITTVAGTAAVGYAGDGGPATQAKLSRPQAVAVNAQGDIFIADTNNNAIRRVDHVTGNISTYAGHKGESDPLGDGGPAQDARIAPLHMQFVRSTGDLYVADFSSHRLRKFDRDGIVSTVAGSAFLYFEGGFGGDDGPATAARLSFDYGDVSGLAINAAGDVFLSDSQNNRVREVPACRSVSAANLVAPANNATGTSTSPRLSWSRADGAFRYNVRLDTANPPVKTVAKDLDETSFTPSNLDPSTKYFWQVVALGDTYCPQRATAASAVNTFTTSGECGAGAFDLLAPADNATNVPVSGAPNFSVTLSWQASSGAGSYDVYYGLTNPPPLFKSGVTGTQLGVTPFAGHLYWFVVAHAACDPTRTATSSVRTFTAAISAGCNGTPVVTLTAPANGATNVATTVDLTWQDTGVDGYDVYFGTTNPPPLLNGDLPGTTHSQSLTALAAGTTYFWKLVAKSICFQGGQQSTAVQSFTTRADCATPGPTSILFAPASVAEGSTYSIVWSAAAQLGEDGAYLVERSLSPNFSSILSSQVTSSTAASFVASAVGTLYHRVRAVAGCDPTKAGPTSETKSVTVVAAQPNVVFTVLPQAVVTSLGDRLEDARGSFTLENIGTQPVQVIVGQSNIDSPPFFSIAGQTAFLTLEPNKPRTFKLRYGGPPNNVAASFQGIVFVAATGQQNLIVTPYAFVNLRVGNGGSGAPTFVVDGARSDYVSFPGFAGHDDTSRASRQITIRNDGTAPMELAAEIGPEVWLVPEAGWNSQPIAPGASRTINLRTVRAQAPNGSKLPRSTYFTVRTRDGASARLLVQDNDVTAINSGRSARLDTATRTFIVPEVVSKTTSQGAPLVTRLRLVNVGSDAVQAELIITPSGVDGFDTTAVKRAVIVVPPNDVAAITDPLVQLFGLQRPASGQLEVKIPRERLGLVNVSSSIVALSGGGGFSTPVVNRGDGARIAVPQTIAGITAGGASGVALTLAETSGVDAATVRASLFDSNGVKLGDTVVQVPSNGHKRIDNFLTTVGAQSVSAGRIDLSVESGGGAVVGVATLGTADNGATFPGRPVVERVAGAAVQRAFWKRDQPDAITPVGVTTVIPVVGASTSAATTVQYNTTVGFVAPPSAAATFLASFRNPSGAIAGSTTITVPGGTTQPYTDIVPQLFGLPANTPGSVFVETTSGKVYAVLQPTSAGSTFTPMTSMQLPNSFSEALTSAASSSQRPLFYDGLEQSVDPTRGSRWMLLLNEMGGQSGTVEVRMYEAGNRSVPIAGKRFSIAPYQQMMFDTLVQSMGLDSADRSKDRTNVEVVVEAVGGSARVAATALSIDNQTGDTKAFALQPSTGSAVPSVSLVIPKIPESPVTPPRRRGARH